MAAQVAREFESHLFRMEELKNSVIALFKDKYIPGHDIKHILRVAALAKLIARKEGLDEKEAEAAGLLHDLGRIVQEQEDNHDTAGLELAARLIESTDFYREAQLRILGAVGQHSQKESVGDLAHILQDADKIDGLGAIGLVRAYTSKSNLVDFVNNEIIATGSRHPNTISEQIAYQMEWYNMLYTDTARQIATRRFEFMKEFLLELQREALEV